MAGHSYWIEDFIPEPALSIRGIPEGTARCRVFLDPPRESHMWARRTATTLTIDEAQRLVRALQEYLVKKAVG